MKKIVLFCIVSFFSFGFSQTPNDPLKVLFVGNSITYFNNLPQTFKQIADEQGYHVTIDQHTPGGTGFVNHVIDNTLYEKFRNTVWDYVILQPGSNESPGFSFPIATTTARAQRLKDSIVKYSPCASIHYYEISYGIVDNTPASFQQYLDRQLLIKNNLTQMGNDTDIPFVPVGECFKNSMQTDSSYFLWGGYMDIHPNPKGSFLAACSFFNALFKQPIVNSNITAGLNVAEANYLRNQAENTTLNNLGDWLINDYTATANFTYSVTNNTTVNFTNTSSFSDNIKWDFGDGTTSTVNTPIHTFDFNIQNEYTVVLTAYKNCKEHHKLIKITQASLSTNEFALQQPLSIYPNPTNGILHIQNANTANLKEIAIFNLLGKRIAKTKYQIDTHLNTIDLSNLPTGVYLIQFNTYENTFTKKIVKQ